MFRATKQLFDSCYKLRRNGLLAIAAAFLMLSPALRAQAQLPPCVPTGAFISAIAGDPSGQIYAWKGYVNTGSSSVTVGVATYIVDPSQPANIDAQVYYDSMVVNVAPGQCVWLQAKVPMGAPPAPLYCSFQADFFLGQAITGPFPGTDKYVGRFFNVDGLFYVGDNCNHPHDGSIGDRIWLDDCDGIQEAGEPGLGGVKVNLKDSGGVIIASTFTDNNGLYQFTALHPGNYTVEVDVSSLPAGVTPSGDFDGVVTPNATIFFLNANEHRTDIDFGYCSNGKVCGTLYCDDNPANGVQDAGEPGLPGVTVTLKDANGNTKTTTTDAAGHYCFTALPAGTYTVTVPNPANGLVITGSTSGSATIPTGGSATLDFRYHGGRISGYVVCLDFCTCPWTITPISGVLIQLKDSHGNIMTTTTNSCGYFVFDDCLAADCYKLIGPKVVNGHKLLTCSELDVCICAGEKKDCNFFAYDCSHAKICGSLFCDDDRDGYKDCKEKGISGATVTLKDEDGNVVATTTTDANGYYCFKNLNAGSYTVVVPSTVGGKKILCASSKSTCLTCCDTDTLNFGYKCNTICGYAFCDRHYHGDKECDEHGIGKICVILKDCNGNEVNRKYCDDDGYYRFDDCKDGSYKVCPQSNYNGKVCRTGTIRSCTVSYGSCARSNHGYKYCCN